jgi:hypothetical protein
MVSQVIEKNDFIKNLIIPNGIITYNEFHIDESIPFEEQRYNYQQDILQIEFGKRFVLDVGWYPEMNPAGHFTVRAIFDNDWIHPVSKIKCRTLSELKKAIEKTANIINKKMKQV